MTPRTREAIRVAKLCRAFMRKVRSNGECHLWVGAQFIPDRLLDSRYGKFRDQLAHRVSYAMEHGSAPERLFNQCGSSLCVNPRHWAPTRGA